MLTPNTSVGGGGATGTFVCTDKGTSGPLPTKQRREGDTTTAEWIEINLLKTGHEGGRPYVRPIDPQWVNELATKWDENKLDVLHVNFDASNDVVVIAGNHRLCAARKRGDQNYRMLCVVYYGLTLQQEAEKFYAIDQNRKRHTVRDGYRAALTYDDPVTVEIEAILNKHGVTVSDTLQGGKMGREEGKVRSVGALYKAHKYADGTPGLFDQAIGVIIGAWGNNSHRGQATINTLTIESMVAFLWRYADLPQFSAQKLMRSMQRKEQQPYDLKEFTTEVMRLRTEYQKRMGKSGNQNMRFGMDVLVRLYNHRRTVEYRLPSRWVELSRTTVKMEKDAYLKAGIVGDPEETNL